MRLALLLFVLIVPFVLSLQPTNKETSRSEVHNREGLSDKTDSFLGTGVEDRGIGDWIKGAAAKVKKTVVGAVNTVKDTVSKAADVVVEKVAGVAGKVASWSAMNLPGVSRAFIGSWFKSFVRDMDAIAEVEGGNKVIFKLVMQGFYTGLSNNLAGAELANRFTAWEPGPTCEIEKVIAFAKASIDPAEKMMKSFVGTESSESNLVELTVKYGDVVSNWNTQVRSTFLDNKDCKLSFLKGPAALAENMVPYGAGYWARPEFRNSVRELTKRTAEGISKEWVTESLRPNKRSDLSLLVDGKDHAGALWVHLVVRYGGLVTRALYEPVVGKAVVDDFSPELRDSLLNLKNFFNAGTSGDIKDIKDAYETAASLRSSPAVTSWQDRLLSDLAGKENVRPEIRQQTTSSFARSMLSTNEQAANTGGVRSSLPRSFGDQDDASTADPSGADGDGNNDQASTAEPSGTDDHSAFLALASHVALPSFNWLAGREQCKLDAPSDQGKCASCWAYAVTNVLDYRLCGSLLRNNLPLLGTVTVRGKTRRSGPTKLSPQVCLSCSDGGGGCKGGAPADCATYLNQRSTTTSQCWPYMSWRSLTSDECFTKTNPSKTCPVGKDNSRGNAVTALNTGYVTGIDMIKAALASGPVTFVMATPATFLSWGGTTTKEDGVFSSGGAPQANGVHSNHVMTAFGWGVENGVEFLLALNTWGAIYNPFVFEGMTFNDEVADPKTGTKGPWLKIASTDPALKIGEYPSFWLTPGVRVGNKAVGYKALPLKDRDGKVNWK